MPDSVGSFYIYQFYFRMIMPEKTVFQRRREKLK
jgi:hypothetical protein